MTYKISIPVMQDNIAPRFDMATEAFIIILSDNMTVKEKKNIVMPRSSADELCYLILSEDINTLICGAIEDEHYQFLKWKKIKIFDSIAGTWSDAFDKWKKNTLSPGDILSDRMIEGKYIEKI
jgi:predicted Fe-Mo cluster-binding NifX family protein